jgi:hypothetical protein
MTEPTYRLATKADAAGVAAIGAQIWDELGSGSGLLQRPTQEGIASLIANQRGGVFVCDSGGEPCGFAGLGPTLTRRSWAFGSCPPPAVRASAASSR